MSEIQDLVVPYQDYYRSSYNLGFHPAVLVGQTMNLDGQRAFVETPLDALSYIAPQSVSNVNLAPNSVSDWNLNNISFNKARGGSLVLGGINNQNGLLQVQDAAGNVIIQEDNTGQTFFDTANHPLVVVSPAGFSNFNTSGGKLTAIDNNGFHTFDGAGNEVTKAANNGYILRNTRGMFFEQTSAGHFGSMAMDGSNALIISSGDSSVPGLGSQVVLVTDNSNQKYVAFRKNLANIHLSDLFSILVLFDSNGTNFAGSVADGSLWYDHSTGQYYGSKGGSRVSFNTTPAP